MAQAFPDTTNIEEISKYRPGVASRIANLLTGGIYGSISGTSEKEAEAQTARRFLLQNRMQDIQNQRMIERIERSRSEALINELQRLASQEKATEERQIAAEQRRRESARPEMTGFIRAQPGYTVGEPDIETLEEMYSTAKAEQAQREEAAKKKSGYIQLNVEGMGTVGGTREQLKAMAEENPAIASALSGQGKKTVEEDYTVTWSVDPLTQEQTPRVVFKSGVPIGRQREIIRELTTPVAVATPSPASPVAPPAGQPQEPLKTDFSIPGYKVRVK